MYFTKIFVIGLNKTGTTSFHRLFLNNNLRSQHCPAGWQVNDYDCFSDGGDQSDWQQHFYNWPNSAFVLNTRPLDHWMRSRAKHGYRYGAEWGHPPSIELYESWIHRRQEHYLATIDFFQKAPEQFFIVNIEKPNWAHFVCDVLHLKNASNLHVYKTPSMWKAIINNYRINSTMNKTFKKLQLSAKDSHSVLLIDSLLNSEQQKTKELISLYKNNLA